ncbi:MAG: hypothetical protein ACNA8N_00505 [Trueperaceae bacterium]
MGRRPRPRLVMGIWTASLVALVACAPVQEQGRVAVQQLAATPSAYPQETGIQWSYLRDGALLDDPRYVETIEGPAVLDGDVWIAFRLVGGGQDVTHYRQFRADGVHLRRQTRPGGSFTFEPPIRELPAEGELRVGAQWTGSTVATGVFPGAPAGQRRFTQSIDYVYTVVDRRPVTVSERVYDVFVIDRTARTFGEDGEVVDEVSQQVWFALGVGKVRHENGWFLVATNFEAAQPAP